MSGIEAISSVPDRRHDLAGPRLRSPTPNPGDTGAGDGPDTAYLARMVPCPHAHLRAVADDALTWLRADPSLRVLAGIQLLGPAATVCTFVAPSIAAAGLAALTVQGNLSALFLIPVAGLGGLLLGALAIAFVGLWIAPLAHGLLPRILLPRRLPSGPTGLLVARPDLVLSEAGATAHQRAQALALLAASPAYVQAIVWHNGRPHALHARPRHHDVPLDA
jgi:hypothetical protein